MTRAAEPTTIRAAALARAQRHAPFLARMAERHSGDAARFVALGRAAALAAINPPPVDASQSGDAVMAGLRQWRGRWALVLALADLAGEDHPAVTTRLLTGFADAACDLALDRAFAERLPGEAPRGLAIIALGKMGSGELNYSSDIDPILLFDPAIMPHRSRDDPAESAVRVARRWIELLSARTADGHVLRVDLRLRPHPEVTPIVLPVDAAIGYYEAQARPWEQAAFIRARAAVGDVALGRAFLDAIPTFVWRRTLDFRQIEEIGSMSGRIRDHYALGQPLGPGYDLKRGKGGIREVEFYAQVHQLIFGGRQSELRPPATTDALAALAAAERIDAGVADRLAQHYWLLRRIEHRLQMVEDQQTHALPADADALDNVARLDGLADGAALLAVLKPAMEEVAGAFSALIDAHGPARHWPTDAAALAEAVRVAGFDPPDAAAARVQEWRSGQVRALRSPAALVSLEVMLPSLMAALGRAPDPGGALMRFDRLVASLPSAINFFHLLTAQPQLAALLTRVLALAPTLADGLAGRASLLDGLIDAHAFDAPLDSAALAARWRDEIAAKPYEAALDHIRDAVGEARFAYGVQLIEAARDPLVIGRGYGALAEAAVTVLAEATIAPFEAMHGRVPGGELVILAMGRLGGGVLTHASDLDLIYLFTGDHLAESDGDRPLGATRYFNRLAQRVSSALSAPTAAGRLYEVDTRLRPSGTQGPLVVSLDSFARYQAEVAWTWEHMAMTRARVIFGSDAARAQLTSILDQILRRPRALPALARDALDMRARIAAHKQAGGPLDVKLGAGGLVDLEFAVQVMRLAHALDTPTDMRGALRTLYAAGHAPDGMVEAGALLERLLILLRLTAGPDGTIAASAQGAVATACGHNDWAALMAAQEQARTQVARWWADIGTTAAPAAQQEDEPQ